jgi:hypothetical protein
VGGSVRAAGNFLVSLAPGTLHEPVLLDFGLVTRLNEKLRHALAKLVVGVSMMGGPDSQQAKPMLLDAFSDLGWPIREDDSEFLVSIAVFLFRETERLEAVKEKRAQKEKGNCR